MANVDHISILDVIGSDTHLKRVANTNGGEYAGPCPFCGGTDRFRVWPNHPKKPRFWCRGCERSGDVIAYLRERDGLTFLEACKALDLTYEEYRPQRPKKPLVTPPSGVSKFVSRPSLNSAEWKAAAQTFVRLAHEVLMNTPDFFFARQKLHKRGIHDQTIVDAQLGYNPGKRKMDWGGIPVTLPEGIVIPHVVRGEVVSLNIRQSHDNPKYIRPTGCANMLYGGDTVMPDDTVLVVEGEFDALVARQALPDVKCVATVSAKGSRTLDTIVKLSLANRVLLAFDNDEAGANATQYWLGILGSKATPVQLIQHDITDMVLAGVNLADWLQSYR